MSHNRDGFMAAVLPFENRELYKAPGSRGVFSETNVETRWCHNHPTILLASMNYTLNRLRCAPKTVYIAYTFNLPSFT